MDRKDTCLRTVHATFIKTAIYPDRRCNINAGESRKMAAQVISTIPITNIIVRGRARAPLQNGMKRTSVRVAAVSEQEVGVKLPATHVSASQNALKQIESANLQGINRTCSHDLYECVPR